MLVIPFKKQNMLRLNSRNIRTSLRNSCFGFHNFLYFLQLYRIYFSFHFSFLFLFLFLDLKLNISIISSVILCYIFVTYHCHYHMIIYYIEESKKF